MIIKQIKTCLLVFVALSILTGLVYPFAVTGFAQLVFPDQANGSLIQKGETMVGSRLIGQEFSDPKYFWGRLSATGPAYNGGASSGSNYGAMHPKFVEATRARLEQLRAADPQNNSPVPVDLVTSSASGLDPHISLAAAQYQKSRIARVRNLQEQQVQDLIDRFTKARFLGLLGEPVVNVLELNLALDEMKP